MNTASIHTVRKWVIIVMLAGILLAECEKPDWHGDVPVPWEPHRKSVVSTVLISR